MKKTKFRKDGNMRRIIEKVPINRTVLILPQDDDPIIRKDFDIRQTIDNNNGTLNTAGETPFLTLQHNRRLAFYNIMVLVFIILFCIFGVIKPVLRTGDYAAVLLADGIIMKIGLFYISWFMLIWATPYILALILLRFGIYSFYYNRLEFDTYFTRRKIIIPYNKMHVIKLKTGIKITTQPLPSWLHPLQRLKVRWWNGLEIGTLLFIDPKVAGIKTGLLRGWANPADGPKAIQILKEKAFSFIEK